MNKAKASILAGVLALTLTVTGCAKNGAMGGGDKVATVDGTVITKAEYDKAYNEFTKTFGLEKVPADQREGLTPMIQQMTLNKLILETLIHNEAKKAGIEVSEADVQAYKKEHIFNNPQLKEQFTMFLSQNAMTEADFDKMLKENLLINKFMEKQGGKELAVSDAEVKTIYQKNVDQFKVPESFQASHILVKAVVPEMKKEMKEKDPKISDEELNKAITLKKDELKQKAEKLLSQVKAQPAKFAELAKANSDDTVSAQNGGELGPMMETTTDPDFWAALEKTPVGQMNPSLVSTMYGYHIVKVLGHTKAHQQTFEEARQLIKDQLSQSKKQEFLKKWAEQKKEQAKIVVEPAYLPKEAPAAMPGGMPAPQAAAPAGEAGAH